MLKHFGSHADTVMSCQSPTHKMYEFNSGDGNAIRARQLSALFKRRDVITVVEVPDAFREANSSIYSLDFEALRGGETIRWGVENGVITPTTVDGVPAWRITDAEREPLFVQIGSSYRTHRTRRWESLQEEKLYRTALKRQATALKRANAKRVAKHRKRIEFLLSAILARDIEVEARGCLVTHTSPGATKLVEIQSYLLQLLDDDDVVTAFSINNALNTEYSDVRALPLPEPEPSNEDLDILGEF